MLAKLINQFANHLDNNSNLKSLNKTFAKLTDYALYHFQFKESMWEECFVAEFDLKNHKNAHADFISNITVLREQAEFKPIQETVENTLSFLTHWLVDHILDSGDMMSKVILAKQAGLPLEPVQKDTRSAVKAVKELAVAMQGYFCDRTIALKREINSHKKTAKKLRITSQIFNNSNDGIVITSANKVIIDVNPAFCNITGYSREQVIGKNPRILSSGKQGRDFYINMWQQLDKKGYWQGEIWNRKKGGELYAEILSITALKDDQANVINYVGLFTDITQLKDQQQQLDLMAHYDLLTGLPNRILFADRFHQAVHHSKRTNTQLAICLFDLDNFKPVNDNFGHEVGEQILVEVASRITACIREEDTVSRRGGDEFTLLLADVESFNQCEKVIQRIHYSVAQPYKIDGVLHKITASSGVTLYPDDDGDIDILLRHADQAMYQAKIEGKHSYQLFNSKQNKQVVEKRHQLDNIKQALINEEFSLYYQPKVNMRTGNVYGAEALIRWQHPEKGLIPPLDFLPLIDGTDLELELGDWVIREAIEQVNTWNKQGIKLEISINIAPHHLQSNTFIAQLGEILNKYPAIDSQSIQLEILESSALGDLKMISNIIKECQNNLGINIALDDFGTGYSSLTHLRRLPVNIIKIDQSFVRDLLDDPDDYAIIDGIIGLADSFNRDIIAEGVETTTHGSMLQAMGCEKAQGYGIARPMPAINIPKWLANYVPNQQWLAYGNKYRSMKENKLELFRLTAEWWKNSFIQGIQQAPQQGDEHWPVMNSTQCHCGMWIKRAIKEQLFDKESLVRLELIHEELYMIARTLLLEYQSGNVEAARAGLNGFQSTFNKMSSIFDNVH
ncbi:MAG: bifunctional diguanylate cyclase/phosphodiesterase [Methylophaga sp.]|nr:MAG: bifunctional diguanylate cyclase/phosphodiesterase [Methylophaga sp.]